MPANKKSEYTIHYNSSRAWTTAMEKSYLRQIGTHRRNFKGVVSRARLLRNYIIAGAGRNWDGLDGPELMAFARNLLTVVDHEGGGHAAV